MKDHGKEIKRVFDDFGIIQVFDDGNKRTLMFGQQDEQGCILSASPQVVQYQYIRAMLLCLLFNDSPKHVLVLGLGSGALATCFWSQFELAHIQVVELRNEIINLGYSHFSLPRSERLKVNCADAGEFVSASPVEHPYDFIFSDIYSANGMDEQQVFEEYIYDCKRQLNNTGWLVLNYWVDHKRSPVMDFIEEQFNQVWVNSIDDENWIVMASDSTVELTKAERKTKCGELARVLGFSLFSALSNFRRLS